jgi:aminopeptidase N
LERHQLGNVVTADLAAVIEELSGRSYDQFFDQWVYHAHHPELDVDYSWDEKTKLAKISVKQTQKLSEEVLLFNFPLTVAFKGKSGRVEKTMAVKEHEEDFYFPLPEAPETVLLNPKLELLAKIDFKNVSTPMLYALLNDSTEVVGRLFAIEQLGNKKDQASVAKLKHALNHDAFFGVRGEAAKALQSIHSDESLEALLASTEQSDARVRNQVAASIAGFYYSTAFDLERRALQKEKNPDILAQHIRALGNYSKPDVREALLPLLHSESFRNVLAEAAITAMRAQDNPSFIGPIRDTLQKRETEFTTRGFASGLDALAYLTRHEEKKESVRDFLLGYVTHKKKGIQSGAIKALGTLEDPQASAVLETFATASKETPERKVAEQALEKIRAARKPTDNLKELREEISTLQKTGRETRKELETLKKELGAKSGKSIRAPKTPGR